MDYRNAINSVVDTISKASKPLSEAQNISMAGAMAVWLEKAAAEEREACAKLCEQLEETGWTDNQEYGSYGEFVDAAAKIRERSNAKLSGRKEEQ